jgi:hypothetical protein
MLYAGNPSSADWWSGIFGFFGWACLPYGILLFLNIIKAGKLKKDIVLLLTTAIVSGFGIILIIDAFFIHIDAQGGLVFLFIPIYQSIAAIAGGLIGLVFYVKS